MWNGQGNTTLYRSSFIFCLFNSKITWCIPQLFDLLSSFCLLPNVLTGVVLPADQLYHGVPDSQISCFYSWPFNFYRKWTFWLKDNSLNYIMFPTSIWLKYFKSTIYITWKFVFTNYQKFTKCNYLKIPHYNTKLI